MCLKAPAARTAVLARELTRAALFDAFRRRRNYAVSNARIVLDFRINGHCMGEKIAIDGKCRIAVDVKGTDRITEVAIVRNGAVFRRLHPNTDTVRLEFEDRGFRERAYYYLRVTQVDIDEHGNPSRAWSSPIWVTARRPHPAAP